MRLDLGIFLGNATCTDKQAGLRDGNQVKVNHVSVYNNTYLILV